MIIERHEVERLADMATKLDEMKNLFPEAGDRERLAQAVEDMHHVAVRLDAMAGYGIYEAEAA